ncbi:MAG: hypothetical protein KDD74_02280, partial [Anaerolineales bacterium]|nr:hypothetical protein [Anaerolineales bacterium]
MNSRSQSFFVYLLLVVAIGAMIFVGLKDNSSTTEPLTISEVARMIQSGQVARIIIDEEDVIRVVKVNGTVETALESRKETNTTLVEQLLNYGVTAEQLAEMN